MSQWEVVNYRLKPNSKDEACRSGSLTSSSIHSYEFIRTGSKRGKNTLVVIVSCHWLGVGSGGGGAWGSSWGSWHSSMCLTLTMIYINICIFKVSSKTSTFYSTLSFWMYTHIYIDTCIHKSPPQTYFHNESWESISSPRGWQFRCCSGYSRAHLSFLLCEKIRGEKKTHSEHRGEKADSHEALTWKPRDLQESHASWPETMWPKVWRV